MQVEDILKVMGQELGYAEASMGFKRDHMVHYRPLRTVNSDSPNLRIM